MNDRKQTHQKNCQVKRFSFNQIIPLHIPTRWVALMIQLEQQQHEEFVVGWGGWLTPTTYIQLAGAGSIIYYFFC